MIKEIEITEEILLLAESKGFNRFDVQEPLNAYGDDFYPPITLGFMQKWLREVHKIWVSPMYIGPDTCKYQCRTDIGGLGRVGEHGAWFESWEECLEDGLLRALKLI